MSDVMFYGVLRMPYEMAMADEISRIQFYGRAQQAADRVERAESELNAARALLREVHEEGNLDAGDQVSTELDNRIYSYLDACDKPGEPDAS